MIRIRLRRILQLRRFPLWRLRRLVHPDNRDTSDRGELGEGRQRQMQVLRSVRRDIDNDIVADRADNQLLGIRETLRLNPLPGLLRNPAVHLYQ
jgi:hypothetical protein